MALQVVAALIVLFEEWGWRPLVALLGTLSRFKPWAQIELWLAGLPPYAALVALALPTSILLPMKFVALYLLAQGHALAATALFIAAKIASTAFIARIFILTKPALMRIGWLTRAYDRLVPWQEAMFALIRASWVWRYGRMLKTRVRVRAKQAWSRLRPKLISQWAVWKPWLDEQRASLAHRTALLSARVRPRLAAEAVRLRLAAREVWERVSGP
jgi:hypothetical protein